MVIGAWGCKQQPAVCQLPVDAGVDATCAAPDPDAGPPCSGVDTGHGTQATALPVTALDASPTTMPGVLANTGATSWFRYDASVGILQSVDPLVRIHSWTAIETCVYVSNCSIACPGGTTPATAPGGQLGCCSSTIDKYQLGCGGDSYTVWMSVQSVEPSQCATCIPYTIGWNW